MKKPSKAVLELVNGLIASRNLVLRDGRSETGSFSLIAAINENKIESRK
jgi:hypothetical protein